MNIIFYTKFYQNIIAQKKYEIIEVSNQFTFIQCVKSLEIVYYKNGFQTIWYHIYVNKVEQINQKFYLLNLIWFSNFFSSKHKF